MASQEKIERRKAVLRARGVPEAFIDNLANRKDGFISSILVIMLLVVIFVGMMSSIDMSEPFARAILPYLFAAEVKSLLFYAPPSIFAGVITLGLLLGFILFLTTLTLWGRRIVDVKPFPHYSGPAVYLRNLAQGETLATMQPNLRYSELAHVPDDTAFLKAIRAPNKSTKTLILLFMVICIPLGVIGINILSDLSKYKSVTLDLISIHKGSKAATYRFADAKYAYVLCYDEPDAVRFHYRIVYPDTVVEMWERQDDLHGLKTEGVIDRLTLIDQKLTSLNIPAHRMPLTGSPRDDGMACVDHAAELWHLQKPEALRRLVFGQ